ncbi:MAG: 2-phospho-L-lactate guanylyltransferase [Bryobacterales bacterium]|nr:2-phospho-L-lactate guanylyltransferase [Bryobacterales bacterium]
MSDIWAIVPIKDLEKGKTRLAPVLNEKERSLLIPAMVSDVLNAFADFGGMPVVVVTGDVRVADMAARRGMGSIVERTCVSESIAVASATAFALAQGAGGTLVVPADIPLITADDIRQIVNLAPATGTLLVPAWDARGTNAAIRRPADLFPLRFGNDSFVPHTAAAEATGYPLLVTHNQNISLDLDSPAELSLFLKSDRVTQTHKVLDRLPAANRIAV